MPTYSVKSVTPGYPIEWTLFHIEHYESYSQRAKDYFCQRLTDFINGKFEQQDLAIVSLYAMILLKMPKLLEKVDVDLTEEYLRRVTGHNIAFLAPILALPETHSLYAKVVSIIPSAISKLPSFHHVSSDNAFNYFTAENITTISRNWLTLWKSGSTTGQSNWVKASSIFLQPYWSTYHVYDMLSNEEQEFILKKEMDSYPSFARTHGSGAVLLRLERTLVPPHLFAYNILLKEKIDEDEAIELLKVLLAHPQADKYIVSLSKTDNFQNPYVLDYLHKKRNDLFENVINQWDYERLERFFYISMRDENRYEEAHTYDTGVMEIFKSLRAPHIQSILLAFAVSQIVYADDIETSLTKYFSIYPEHRQMIFPELDFLNDHEQRALIIQWLSVEYDTSVDKIEGLLFVLDTCKPSNIEDDAVCKQWIQHICSLTSQLQTKNPDFAALELE